MRLESRAMPRNRAKASAEPSLLALLSAASRRASADLERVLEPEGLPYEQWRVLEVLADENGRSMSALAEAVEMKLPSLSKLIDRMVASALVQRAPDPQDQRRVLVYVSDIGLQRFRSLKDPVRRKRSSIESRLGSDRGQELKRLLREFLEDSR